METTIGFHMAESCILTSIARSGTKGLNAKLFSVLFVFYMTFLCPF